MRNLRSDDHLYITYLSIKMASGRSIKRGVLPSCGVRSPGLSWLELLRLAGYDGCDSLD